MALFSPFDHVKHLTLPVNIHLFTQRCWKCHLLIRNRHTHTHTNAKAIGSNLGFSIFSAEGHFRLAGWRIIETTSLLISRRPALPPEPKLPTITELNTKKEAAAKRTQLRKTRKTRRRDKSEMNCREWGGRWKETQTERKINHHFKLYCCESCGELQINRGSR